MFNVALAAATVRHNGSDLESRYGKLQGFSTQVAIYRPHLFLLYMEQSPKSFGVVRAMFC